MSPPSSVWNGLLSRRDVLRVGSLGLTASLLAHPGLPAGTAATAGKEGFATARSVIILWMAGGVTHLDSFDPKPEAPDTIRGALSAMQTTIPGVRFCETLPQLARQAQHLAVVRSFSHDSNDHFVSSAHVLSGRKVNRTQITTEPNVGAIVSKLHGGRGGLPGYIAVPGTTRPGQKNLFVAGWLGVEYGPFSCGGTPIKREDFKLDPTAKVNEEQFNQQALQLPAEMDLDRLGDRHRLRERLEAGLGAANRDTSLAAHYQHAFDMLTSPAIRRAFELRQESDRVREAYGRTKIGGRCLLARRLVEAGARFILLDYGYDPDYGNLWDNHPAPRQPGIGEMVKRPYHLAGVDRAFAALLADLHARGRLAETLVVFLTEFGRTPKINKEGGRDHWGAAGSIFFAGGGTRGGHVIGATDKHGAFPTGRGFTPGDVAATLYQAIGIDPETVLRDREDRPQPVLPQGTVIPGIFGSEATPVVRAGNFFKE
jgi:hypothetical protein